MKKTILFAAYGGGHAHMIYPVIEELKTREIYKKGNLDIKVLALTSAKTILNKYGIKSFGFVDYLDESCDADAIKWGTELAKVHHSDKSGIDLKDSIAYLGLNYKDLVTRLGADSAQNLLKEKGRHAFFPLSIMARIFDDIKPDFVVTTNSPRSEAAAIATANQRGIENLIITDLFTGLGGYKLCAKTITFINDFAMRMHLEDGLLDSSKSEFIFTGNPAFDKLTSASVKRDPNWLAQKFLVSPDTKWVLHADMPAYWDPFKKTSHIKTEEENLRELEAVYQATIKSNATYLIRPHPSQNNSFFLNWLKNKKNAYLVADLDLHQLLINSSLLVVRTSTVGLEAAYLGARILQLDADFHKDLPLAKMGLAWGVNSLENLSSVVENALINVSEFNKIQEHTSKVLPRDRAALKIANILVDKLA